MKEIWFRNFRVKMSMNAAHYFGDIFYIMLDLQSFIGTIKVRFVKSPEPRRKKLKK